MASNTSEAITNDVSIHRIPDMNEETREERKAEALESIYNILKPRLKENTSQGV